MTVWPDQPLVPRSRRMAHWLCHSVSSGHRSWRHALAEARWRPREGPSRAHRRESSHRRGLSGFRGSLQRRSDPASQRSAGVTAGHAGRQPSERPVSSTQRALTWPFRWESPGMRAVGAGGQGTSRHRQWTSAHAKRSLRASMVETVLYVQWPHESPGLLAVRVPEALPASCHRVPCCELRVVLGKRSECSQGRGSAARLLGPGALPAVAGVTPPEWQSPASCNLS